MKDELSLRLVRSSDLDFLRRVYASTRIDELRQVDWSSEQKDFFIGMQFEAQHKYYRENYKKAEFLIVIKGDTQVGRLYVDRRPDDIRIMDLALLPEFRGEKIGTKILENLLEEGNKKRIKVSFHVERHNRAIRLYKRLGFEKVGTDGVYFLMERDPAK